MKTPLFDRTRVGGGMHVVHVVHPVPAALGNHLSLCQIESGPGVLFQNSPKKERFERTSVSS